MRKIIIIIILLVLGGTGLLLFSNKSSEVYYMPEETEKHEATWLQWPHTKLYGRKYRTEIEPIWIEMTKQLVKGEKVNLMVYNQVEEDRVYNLLLESNIDMSKINFYIVKTDDVWARDTAPIYVYDDSNQLKMLDFDFNGWGNKMAYQNDQKIPEKIEALTGIKRIKIHDIVLEGGSIELDGDGTMIATESSILNSNRNPGLSKKDFEQVLEEYLDTKHFIWLKGQKNFDITDFHIDGFVKFLDNKTMITLKDDDLADWGLSDKDIDILAEATNKQGAKYNKKYLPLTQKNVVLENGKNLKYKGSYINYYVGNEVVLVPNYNDPNDKVANALIQSYYPDRKVVGIDVRELYKNGGMIHCVTQQQPEE